MKEIFKRSKYREKYVSWVRRINPVEMSVLPKVIYTFIIITIKIPERAFTSIDKVTLNFIQKGKQTWRTNTILKKKYKVGGISLSNFKTYNIATVIKILWYWQMHRLIDQQTKIENSEINPYKYAQLIFDKGEKAIQ